MCLWQAENLERSRQLLLHHNYDVNFIVINSYLPHAIDNVGELSRRVNFPVYQDTTHSRIWESLRGGKDDIFIYDKCGTLTYYVPFPQSLLYKQYFRNALMDTLDYNVCNCHHHSQSGTSHMHRTSGNRHRTRTHGGYRRRHQTHGQHQHRHRRRRHVDANGHMSRGRLREILTNRISK